MHLHLTRTEKEITVAANNTAVLKVQPKTSQIGACAQHAVDSSLQSRMPCQKYSLPNTEGSLQALPGAGKLSLASFSTCMLLQGQTKQAAPTCSQHPRPLLGPVQQQKEKAVGKKQPSTQYKTRRSSHQPSTGMCRTEPKHPNKHNHTRGDNHCVWKPTTLLQLTPQGPVKSPQTLCSEEHRYRATGTSYTTKAAAQTLSVSMLGPPFANKLSSYVHAEYMIPVANIL
jgi:hypothetical protein